MAAQLAMGVFRRSSSRSQAGVVTAAAAVGVAIGGSALRCDDAADTDFRALMRFQRTTSIAGADRGNLRLAVPKKGTLKDDISKILAGSGIEYVRKDRLDVAKCKNLPVTIIFLPSKDIATYVGEGDVDLGFTGEDIVAESQVDVNVLMHLGFPSDSRLSVLAPADKHLSAKDLAGKRIVTNFPHIAQEYFKQHETDAKTDIRVLSGSLEAACELGLADGIVDLMQTGTRSKTAGLEEVAEIMKTQAVLISNPHSPHQDVIDLITRRIRGHMTAKEWLVVTYNLPRENVLLAQSVIPKETTQQITKLDDENWFAVSVLVPRHRAHSTMDDLQSLAGARDIILTKVDASRPASLRSILEDAAIDEGRRSTT